MDAFGDCILITDPIDGTSGPNWETDRMAVGLGTLVHDVGKPSTTIVVDPQVHTLFS